MTTPSRELSTVSHTTRIPASPHPDRGTRPKKIQTQSSLLSYFVSTIAGLLPVLVALVGVHYIVETVFPPYHRLITRFLLRSHYLLISPSSHFSLGVALLIIAGALGYRKRIGWLALLGIVLLALLDLIFLYLSLSDYSALAHKTLPHTPIFQINYTTSRNALISNIIVLAVVLACVLVTYKRFNTTVRKGNILYALTTLIGGLLLVSLLGIVFFKHDYQSINNFSLFKMSFRHSLGFSLPQVQSPSTILALKNKLIGVATATVYIISLIVLMRSQKSVNAMTPSDETVVRRLNSIYGKQDSLAYYATRRDKAIVWAPNALSAITYRVEIGVCIASADPLGEEKSWPQAIKEWISLCKKYGWTPAVEGASKLGAQYYAQAGLGSWQLGDEAIIYADKYSISGSQNKSLRQSVNRARRSGLQIKVRRQSELTTEELATIEKNINNWRMHGDERGFSMALGRVGDPEDGDVLIVEAYKMVDGTSVPYGILSFVPWGTSGVSLDIMRRSKDSPNGTVEYMVSELALNHQKYGITKISLNFAMLRRVFAEGLEIGSGPMFRLWYKFLLFASKFWQLETLYNSSEKYHPEWFPRYTCYPSAISIPKVGFAIGIAEGFVSPPAFLTRWKRNPNHLNRHTGLYPQVPPAALQPDFLAGAQAQQQDTASMKRPEQVAVRIAKVQRLMEKGVDPYPPASSPSETIVAARELPQGTQVSVSGRIFFIRSFGGVLFAVISDWNSTIQIILEGKENTKYFNEVVDLGDIIQVSGTITTSRKGELSIQCDNWTIQGKSLHPLPAKRKGLGSVEARTRLRHIDLTTSAQARHLVEARTTVVRSVRNTLDTAGFTEVETPILNNIHGGANATPFTTHINAYNADLYLRIAPELYLKRLLVGGMSQIYEMGKQFRNEGVDSTHNPEFTSLEAYHTYGDYMTMSRLARSIIQNAARAVHGEEIVMKKNPDGSVERFDISGEWPIIPVCTAVSRAVNATVNESTPKAELQKICADLDIAYLPQWDSGQLILELYEHLVEDTTVSPTFYCDFPVSVSPLTREHRTNSQLSERWDLVVFGMELGTAYTELTNPLEQRKRFHAQSLKAAAGDVEAMQIDEDFLQALEFAMPPTGGLGIGIDRLIMLITGKNIRETLLFPFTKLDTH